MNLYQITQEQKAIISEIEYLDGEITPELEQALMITESQLKQKSIAYLEVISQKDGFNELIDNEIKRLQALKKRNTNIISLLKENLLNAIKTFGDFTVDTHSFRIRKSSSVDVEDVNSLPNEFKTIKVIESADKIALKKALQEGQTIKGVSIIEHQNLKIS